MSLSLDELKRQKREDETKALRVVGCQEKAKPAASSNCQCDGSGWYLIDGKANRCDCFKEKIVQASLEALAEGFRRFRHATFNSYIAKTDVQAKTKAAMRDCPHGSFWLNGDVELGKTHLLVSQYRANVHQDNNAIAILTEDDLRQLLIRDELREKFLPSLLPWRGRQSFHLFLDDLGTVDKPTKFYLASFDHFIDEFYRQSEQDWNAPGGMKLSVTSNLSLEELRNRYGVRSIRRLEDMCKIAELK